MVNSVGALARDVIAKPIDNLVSKKTGNKTIFRDNSGVLSDIKNAMELALGKKFDAKPELRELNYKALEMGMAMIEKVGA